MSYPQLIALIADLDGYVVELQLIADGTLDESEINLKLEGIRALVEEYLVGGEK